MGRVHAEDVLLRLSRENFDRLNAYRTQRGKASLRWCNTLYALAHAHSRDMYNSDVLKHSKLEYAENVAYSLNGHRKGIAKTFIHQWRKSATGHKQNMISNIHRYAAVAIYGDGDSYYGTQLFSLHEAPNSKVERMTKPRKLVASIESGGTEGIRCGMSGALSTTSVSASRCRAIAVEIFDMVNEYRRAKGQERIEWNECMYEVAVKDCKRMYETGALGESMSSFSENTARVDDKRGHCVAKTAFVQWKRSGFGHRENMIADIHRYGAAGVYGGKGVYFCSQLFSLKKM